MSDQKYLVVDANIIMRAVLGVRAMDLLDTYEATAPFHCAEISVADVRGHLSKIIQERDLDAAKIWRLLDRVLRTVQTVDASSYGMWEDEARKRIASRDVEDWPVVATALLLDCPVWTEDQDFFGCGVATWTTQTVELYPRG